jgi:hypothetical protein
MIASLRGLTTTLCFVMLLAMGRAQEAARPSPGVERLEKAETQFWTDQKKVEADFRKGLAEAIESADKIEVFLLEFDSLKEDEIDFSPESRGEDPRFPISPYKSSAKILKRRALTSDELKDLRPALMAVVGIEKETGGSFCHFPVHGLRVFEGESVIFESSFCYFCENFYIRYPSEAHWFGMSSKAFETIMKRLIPIPESELKRFEAYSKPKAKK